MRRWLKCYFLCLLGLCFVDVALSLALVVGLKATPWNTMDSRGRTMGFNDQFSLEHYEIALRNIRPDKLFRTEFGYEGAVLIAILIGIWCLGSESRRARAMREWYFHLQLGVFFPGIVGMVLFWPRMMLDLVSLQADREFFDDMPTGLILTHSPWALLSLTIALVLRADSLSQNEMPESECRPVEDGEILLSR
jgi:hypothetical protein